MHISAEPFVVGKIPADVIGILINHDVVRVPEPPLAKGYVKGSNAPVPSVEPEAARPSAGKVPDVMRTKATTPMAMLPWAVEMIVRIVAASIVADPDLSVDVRHAGMAFMIAEVVPRFVVFWGAMKWSRTMCGRRTMCCTMLGKYRQREND